MDMLIQKIPIGMLNFLCLQIGNSYNWFVVLRFLQLSIFAFIAIVLNHEEQIWNSSGVMIITQKLKVII
jgi:hypothetical protein